MKDNNEKNTAGCCADGTKRVGGAVIGIDVGGTTTKIVGFRHTPGGERILITPQFVRATDPMTSIYGAFGKFTVQNNLSLGDIDRVIMTGVGSANIQEPIFRLDCRTAPEFTCLGLGGLYLSELNDAIVVSLGTGTALVHAKKTADRTEIEYLGGTGMGGGTLVGLTKKLTGLDNFGHIEKLCQEGHIENIDLRIRDLSEGSDYPGINLDLTASNFGKVSDMATPADLALGIANMVAETIAMIAIFAARRFGLPNIVLTGNLTRITAIRNVFLAMSKGFGVRFLIPQNAEFGTVIGAALYQENQEIHAPGQLPT